jgi:GNAT superfamily N-acetyltransferase
MPAVQIIRGYLPGSLGRVAELHGTYYHKTWGFGLFFEAKVATELAAFLGRYDVKKDAFWTAQVGRQIEGSLTIDGIRAATEGAHLRWYIISDELRGQGAGNQLMSTAIDFCRSRGYRRVYLWTFEGLNADGTFTRKTASGLSDNTEEASGVERSTNSDSSWSYDTKSHSRADPLLFGL